MNQQQLLRQSTELLRFYKTNHKTHTGSDPLINMYKEKWTALSLIESYGFDTCKSAILWYFKVSQHYDWRAFVRIVDQCVTESRSTAEDIKNRRKYRAIANEWRSA